MKSLFFLAAFVLNYFSIHSNTMIFDINVESCIFFDEIIDSIVMEDDIMLVSTSKSNGDIMEIQVIDSNDVIALTNLSCTSFECSTDLSNLAAGRYTVEVETDQSYIFSGTIDKL